MVDWLNFNILGWIFLGLIVLQYIRSFPLVWHLMLIWKVIKGLFIEKPFTSIHEKVISHHRVLLDDMDLNIHMYVDYLLFIIIKIKSLTFTFTI